MKKYSQIILLVVFLCALFLNLKCKKDDGQCLTCPPPATNCEYPAGNRNFTWRIDTVAWWPSTLGGLWAFSDNDAWVMGNMCGPTVPGQTNYMGLHWNGQRWDDTVKFLDIFIEPNDVIGDASFMAAVGYRMMPEGTFSTIVEYDNKTKKWKTYQFQSFGELRSVWTDGSGYFIAVGDNGMVYTKDGYLADWVYQKASTDFNFTKVTGVSKTEIYTRAVQSLATGEYYDQIWKYLNNSWIKLMDNKDTTDMPIKIPEAGDEVYEIAACRCSITDSLYLYIVGRESFEFTTKGNSLIFLKNNLAEKGLPSSQEAAGFINLFSPNDYWVSGIRYQLYHWNSSNFQKIEPIPYLPYGQLWGVISRIKRNNSGKIWMVLEMDSQIYAILQAVP